MRPSYSAYIYALSSFLKCSFPNLKIKHYSKLPKGIAGRCSYKQNWIKIAAPDVMTAREALITLAHEGGHYWSYIRSKTEKDFEEYNNLDRRELLAYLYGWALITLIGAKSVISKEEWRDYHNYGTRK